MIALVVCAMGLFSCDNVNLMPPPPPGMNIKDFNPDKMEKLNKEFIIKEARLTPEEQQIILPILFQVNNEKRKLRHDMRHMTKRVECEPDITDADCEKILEQVKQCRDAVAKLNLQLYDELQNKGISARKILLVVSADGKFRRSTFKSMAQKENEHKEDDAEQKAELNKAKKLLP